MSSRNSSPTKDKAMVKVFRKLRSGGMGRRRSRQLKTVSSTTSLPEHRSAVVDLEWDLESMESSVAPQGYSANSEISPRSMSIEETSVGHRDEKSAGDSTSELPLVVYNNNNKSSSPHPTLPDALQTWVFHADVLIKSKEMQALLGSTQSVAFSALHSGGLIVSTAGDMVVHTICLPVTIPLKLTTSAIGLVVDVTEKVAMITFGDSSCGESTSSTAPLEGMIQGVFNVVPVVVDTAGRITHEVGSTALGILGSMLGLGKEDHDDDGQTVSSHRHSTSSGERSSEKDSLLDRLRLDIHISDNDPHPVTISVSKATPSDTSKYLLRVDDLNVTVSQDDPISPINNIKILFVDLGKEFSDENLTQDALDQLVEKGINIVGSNADANVSLFHPLLDRASNRINWKPDDRTRKLLRKMGQQSIMECYKSLESSILIWSGKLEGSKYYGSDNPLFLARGVVRRSPREFMNLLWDSERTHEYNKFSLGRTDVLVIEDNIPEGGSYGAKVIKSETKVPFTGLKVGMSVLMHARALEGGSEDGFIIVSRSLSAGMAGCHVGRKQRVDADTKNEILLGVNIMRSVPGKPELTDLISVSQVSSKIVPQFLAFKIGMMGVEDFFKNVRQ